MQEVIAEGPLTDLDFRMNPERDSTLSITDTVRNIGILINIKATHPETEGEYDDLCAVLPPRKVLVMAYGMGAPKLNLTVEGELDDRETYMTLDTIMVTFRGDDGKYYEVCYGMQSETAVFSRRDGRDRK